ncbi:hypothetical protein VOLCADRAFT_91260 [Volvox carteri f. nagariensis]|uniref:Mitochondrial transcription termination factor n=1 Tax=Volvox carteri f. nagariensis TaxID=3068 RepID=D8TWK9_VOLCA|nr:uncharacterized protein VOLCADRAFT_91260 [Volvox carteri f. nagariensis]EFJ48066.1 hypothetical protein VOLCADRAFT_91260 [Volvox carteri f. nagariensis]|eukprot:XP_002950751.1 hypothetical protein VOLCADRAFT_91260 [Volvox carteri f. nagariensis]
MRSHLSNCQLRHQKPSQRPRRRLVITRAWHVSSSQHSVCNLQPSRRPQLEHLIYEIINVLALPAEPSPVDLQRWSKNIDVLQKVHGAGGAERVRRALLANPSLLSADLERWHSFFVAGFGLPPDGFAKLLTDCPSLLTEGDVFTAGSCMLFFKNMGWRNQDITQRIIGYYPQLLLLDRRRDIDPVLRFLERLECRGDNLRLLVWEFPRIFDKDYRRHVRKFQYLGMYGLSVYRNGGGGDGTSGGEEGGGGRAAAAAAAAAVTAVTAPAAGDSDVAFLRP